MWQERGKEIVTTNLFTAISSEKMASLINEASGRIIIVAPAIFSVTAKALLEAQYRLGSESITVVVDCDEEVLPDKIPLDTAKKILIRLWRTYGR